MPSSSCLGSLYYVSSLIVIGYGETVDSYDGDRSKFILSIIQSELLSGNHPVLISPSMSGEYSVKFVGEHSDLVSGYMPVAPVATGSVSQQVLQKLKVSVCVCT
jgi:abhydrolase domain-containing protein 14